MALSKPAGGAHLLPVAAVDDAVGKGIAQQRMGCVGRLSLGGRDGAWEGAAEAVVRVDAAREAAVVAVRAWAGRPLLSACGIQQA
jgi:hypothetical protein